MEYISKYAKYIYKKQDEDLIKGLDEYINKDAEAIYSFFNITEKKQAEITIMPTKKEYDEWLKDKWHLNEVPGWNIGNAYDGNITYVSLHDYKNTDHAYRLNNYDKALDNYNKTIVHEYVHFVTVLYIMKNNINKPLRYLTEGIAGNLSHQIDDINKDFHYSLEDILDSNNCYMGYYLMVKFILDNYGRDYFFKLLDNKEYALEETKKIYKKIKKDN